MIDPQAAARLRPLLKAGKLGRYRVLDICCPRGHRFAEILRAGDALILIAIQQGFEIITRPGQRWPSPRNKSRAEKLVKTVDMNILDDFVMSAQCECALAVITGPWLREQLRAGRRRVVVDRA